jgi:hypothetical protein
MDLILPLAVIAAGILAASGLIVSKSPQAKDLIAKLQPFQALIGIFCLAWSVYYLFLNIGFSYVTALMSIKPLFGVALLGMFVSGILLGLMFGIPMIAKMSAAGAEKATEMAQKLAPFQLLIGLAGIACSLVFLLYRFGILSLV